MLETLVAFTSIPKPSEDKGIFELEGIIPETQRGPPVMLEKLLVKLGIVKNGNGVR